VRPGKAKSQADPNDHEAEEEEVDEDEDEAVAGDAPPRADPAAEEASAAVSNPRRPSVADRVSSLLWRPPGSAEGGASEPRAQMPPGPQPEAEAEATGAKTEESERVGTGASPKRRSVGLLWQAPAAVASMAALMLGATPTEEEKLQVCVSRPRLLASSSPPPRQELRYTVTTHPAGGDRGGEAEGGARGAPSKERY